MAWVDGLQKVGDVYHCRIRHDGREIRRSTGKRTLEAARRWLRDFRDTLDDVADGGAPAPSVLELVEQWEVAHSRIHTQAHRDRVMRDLRRYLLPRFGEVLADKVTTADISGIRRDYLDALSPHGRLHTVAGANSLLRSLTLVWRWGVREGLLRSMPWSLGALRTQRRPKPTIPADFLSAFLAEIDKARNPHVRIAVRAMVLLGLRENEALSMRWEWFAQDGSTYAPGRLGDDGRFRSKGGEAVNLPVPPDLWAMIQALPKNDSPWVLPAEREKDTDPWLPHAPQFTKKAIARAGIAVGVPKMTPHRLRGTCATLLARAGADPFVIQGFMRHKKIETTLEYVEVAFRDFHDAQSRLVSGIRSGMPGGNDAPNGSNQEASAAVPGSS